jgi:hypothetical protein
MLPRVQCFKNANNPPCTFQRHVHHCGPQTLGASMLV